MNHDNRQMLQVAQRVAVEAGKLLLKVLDEGFAISRKGQINLVTEADLRSEALIVERLLSEFPSHRILAEEDTRRESDSDFRWIIDPLDGTTNFAHRYRFFCVSIGLEKAGELELGVVYDPVVGELFSAAKGDGAWLGEKAIRVSQTAILGDAMLSTGFAYDRETMLRNLELFNRILPAARAVRRDGAAALDLCYLACGRFDGFWELGLKAWDLAAGQLIIEEAGGRVTRFDGSRGTIFDGEVLASNGVLHPALSELLTA